VQAITEAFRTLKNTSHTIQWIVYLAGAGKILCTWPASFQGPWTLDEPIPLSGVLALDSQRPASDFQIVRIDQGGLGAIDADLQPHTGEARISGWRLALANQGLYSRALDGVRLDQSVIQVRLGFVGQGITEALPLFTGVIDAYEISLDRFQLAAIDGSFTRHRSLSVSLGAEAFPAVASGSRGKAIPIILGRNTDMDVLPLRGEAVGTLAFDAPIGATSVTLVEFAAGFPASGTITLGTETGVTYTEQSVVIFNTTSYLQLRGLTRPASVLQPAGSVVILENPTFDYLIGYSVFDLSAVRVAGVVQTSGYTFVQGIEGADRPVSVLTFATEPAGTVTVDVRGGNFVPRPEIQSGTFEGPSTAGWTLTGATLTATTGNVVEGLYKGELLGGLNSNGTMSQDFATLPGQYYTVGFNYRDNEEGLNLVPDPDLVGGQLTPWVITSGPWSATIRLVRQAYNERYGFAIGGEHGFQGAIAVDVPTTSGTAYVLRFWYTSEYFLPSGASKSGAQLAYWKTTAGYGLGSATAPDSLARVTLPQQRIGWIDGAHGLEHLFYDSGQIPFTATATSTRLTLYGEGFSSSGIVPVLFGQITIIEANTVSRSRTSYTLGTPATPTLYANATLDQRLGYTLQETVFKAQTSTTRLTIASLYTLTGLPVPTYLDNIQARDGGLNPVQAIRYILRNFLPSLPINEASFDVAEAARARWQFGGVLSAPGHSRALILRMAEQGGLWYYEDARGQATLVPKPLEVSALPVFAFDDSVILEDTLRAVPEPLDNVYTDFYLWYGYKGEGDRQDSTSYQGVVYATPTSSSGVARFAAHCALAVSLYGRRQRRDLYLDLIQDAHTALRLLEYEVLTRTLRHLEITFQATFVAIHLERGDVVLVSNTLLPNGMPQLCTVQGHQVDAGRSTVTIRARSIGEGGWSEVFDEPPFIVTGAGWEEAFDT